MMRHWKRIALGLMAAGVVVTLGVVVLTDGFSNPKGKSCGLVGCSSDVAIDIRQLPRRLPSARRVEVCVAGRCSENAVYETYASRYRSREAAFGEGQGLLKGLGPYRVSVTVFDPRGRVLLRAATEVKMNRFYPDGIGCGSPCFSGAARLDVNSGQLNPLPGGSTRID